MYGGSVMKTEILRLERVTYRRDNTTILNNLSMSMMKGDIMGLQPLETYGLEELLSVLTENPPLYFGYVYYMEQCVNAWNAARHERNRISVIGTRSTLVGDLDILTNVFVLRPGFRQERISEKMLVRQLQPFLDDLGIRLDPKTTVDRLSPYERVLVELLRAVVAGHHLIIFREISSVISEEELKDLHRLLRHYARRGFSFLYISMHFEEIMQVCSSTAIYHDARIDMIIEEDFRGKSLPRSYYQDYYNHVSRRLRRCRPDKEGEEVFSAELLSDDLKGFAFSVREGECLVIQNMETRIYNRLVEVLTRENDVSRVRFAFRGKQEDGIRRRKMAVLREEPGKTMIFEDLSVLDNLCITLDHKLPSIWARKKARDSVREEYVREFGTDICSRHTMDLTRIERLRLIYMRVWLEKPDVVFLLQPFKGADVEERYQIFKLQEMLLKKGMAVVILAVSMGDSLAIADRVIRLASVRDRLDVKEYRYEDFPKLPGYLPWVDVYDENMEKEPVL